MLKELKTVTGFQAVSNYFVKSKWYRKAFDAILVCLIMIVWGFSQGHIKIESFNVPSTHTVEHTFKQSNEIQKILDGEQYKNQYNFVGSFKFHNGTQGLDGFNFMKWSLTEYSSGIGISVDPLEMQNIPIVINMPMVSALVEGKCYSSVTIPKTPLYITALRMNVQSYTACPIVSRQNQLIGYILVGVNTTTPPSHESVEMIVDKIEIFRR